MTSIVDNAIALRLVYLLQMPFTDFDAYALGVIDSNGNILKKSSQMTQEEKDSVTYLHRLIFRVKRMLASLPGGDSRLKSLVASFLLMRECLEGKRNDILLEDITSLSDLVSSDEISLFEEIASTAVANVQGLDLEPLVNRKPKMVRRNEKRKYPRFKEIVGE
jgi:hypothetical protein